MGIIRFIELCPSLNSLGCYWLKVKKLWKRYDNKNKEIHKYEEKKQKWKRVYRYKFCSETFDGSL